MQMLNNVYQKFIRNGKLNLPTGKTYLSSPFPVHRLVLKKDALRDIMRVKGWKTYADVGSALGFTRQYIAMLVNTKVSVSSEFISRMAVSLGNISENWHIYYEIIPWGVYDHNHPLWNKEKHDGKIPYEKYSIAAELRKKDYSVEKLDHFD